MKSIYTPSYSPVKCTVEVGNLRVVGVCVCCSIFARTKCLSRRYNPCFYINSGSHDDDDDVFEEVRS